MTKRRRTGGGATKHQKDPKTVNGVSRFCLTDLPIAVLHEILFKLPINSIMKLKRVCRSLFMLITHPDFALNYSKNSPFTALLLPQGCFDPYSYHLFNLLEFSDNLEYIKTTFKPKIPGYRLKIPNLSLVGTCNGLLCLTLRKPKAEIVYVCNPIMGERITVHERRIHGAEFPTHYEFGFCGSSSNYKLLRIVCGYEHLGEGEIVTVGVDDRWRVLANLKFPLPRWTPKFIAHNGVFHWFVTVDHSTWIATFDLGEEKVGRFSLPQGLVLNIHDMRLTSISDHLCIVDNSDRHVFVLWKMKEYGVAESWIKDIVLDFSLTPGIRLGGLIPLAILRNGDILFSDDLYISLVQYNPMQMKFTKIRGNFHGRIAYASSILSIKEVITGGNGITMNAQSK